MVQGPAGTGHLWIGGLVLAAMVASPAVRGAAWMNLASLAYDQALLADGPGKNERMRRARDFAGRAIAVHASSSRPFVLAATIESALEGPAAAVTLWEQAVKLEPANDGIRFQLAEAYHAAGADDLALVQWRNAAAVPMLLQQGYDARNAGDIDGALTFFDRAARVDPAAYVPWTAKGDSLWRLQRFEEAREAFEHAIEIDPGRSRAYELLGALLMGPLEKLEEAETVVALGFTRTGESSDDLFLLRSRLAFLRGDYPSAERDAREAIGLSPRSGNYLAWLGELYYHQQRYQEALEQYKRTLAWAAEPVWQWRGYLRLGQTYGALDNWSAAVAAYRTALELSIAQDVTPVIRAQNRVVLGEALQHTGETELAKAEFTRALADDPANDRAARLLAAMRLP